jgi:gliding motility-associated-like protein
MLTHLHKIFFFLFILSIHFCAYSQGTCPSNMDFESGTLGGWICKTGSVSAVNGQNTIRWTATGQVNGRHTIIPSSNITKDFYGNFPVSCPNGSSYSVMLGNAGTGSQAEGIFFNYTIPANATKFSVTYQYAVVFQEPTGHLTQEQPRFQARFINLSDGNTIGCVSFDFTADGTLPGFQQSPRSTPTNIILYKDWTPIKVDLSNYAGKTIQVEFITSDCTRGGHFGYAYIDVNSSCSSTIVSSNVCQGDSFVTLTAPPGYFDYSWYTDNTFSQLLGTGQVLTLNPAPTAGSIFPLIITPYPGYGCVDTLYATTNLVPKPLSNAGPNVTACTLQKVQIGSNPNPSYAYEWSPANLISNPSAANPFAFLYSNSPVDFVVKTTDINTKCFSYDTVTVIPKVVDTALQVSGPTAYCSNMPTNTSFQIASTSTNVQWMNNSVPVAGAINTIFSPTTAGQYWAQFSQDGCLDSTRIIPFIINPTPVATYNIDQDTQCITNNSFVLTNASTISDNSTLSYLWNFGDGTTSQLTDPVKQYTSGGFYNIKLITSSGACIDSIQHSVYLIPNVSPSFRYDSACTNRPITFINTTAENGASVTYLWDFANGLTSSQKDPLSFTYKDSGVYNVSLKATSVGCETDPKTVSHQLNAYLAMTPIKYPDKTVAAGYTIQLAARDKGLSYKWSPATQLNTTNLRGPYFYSNNDIKYFISVTDKHTCTIIDTQQVYVLKKKGIYLPSAFTPNGDGLNDIVTPYVVGMKALKKFSIYNRWGFLVFSTTIQGESWNGTYQGKQLDTGSFVWILEYVDTDDKVIVQKGTITLIK